MDKYVAFSGDPAEPAFGSSEANVVQDQLQLLEDESAEGEIYVYRLASVYKVPSYIVGLNVSADIEVPIEAYNEEVAKEMAQRLVEGAEIFSLGAVNTEVWGTWEENEGQ